MEEAQEQTHALGRKVPRRRTEKPEKLRRKLGPLDALDPLPVAELGPEEGGRDDVQGRKELHWRAQLPRVRRRLQEVGRQLEGGGELAETGELDGARRLVDR